MPFGGVKDSGTGREGTRHSLELFTEEKTHCVKINWKIIDLSTYFFLFSVDKEGKNKL